MYHGCSEAEFEGAGSDAVVTVAPVAIVFVQEHGVSFTLGFARQIRARTAQLLGAELEAFAGAGAPIALQTEPGTGLALFARQLICIRAAATPS